ncbi:hypothetical protein Krac_5483 [Ktedonobacter racemifer DSM 44963]|uniref:Uncharacterized protein n=1 Tax=Ktedonobacter racemifer DSM 44963 TaxID=485913 RepID=D6TW58_KTERA|nr:hypothetical protein Krac_5483 [Ktedonobacter racemifer DSM 44963]
MPHQYISIETEPPTDVRERAGWWQRSDNLALREERTTHFIACAILCRTYFRDR